MQETSSFSASPEPAKLFASNILIGEVEKHAREKGLPILTVYVNAGRTRTPYYTMLEIVKGVGLNAPNVGWQMFRLKQAFERLLMDKSVVIAIDEVDALLAKEREPLIYYLNRQPKTTLILISNKIEDATQFPERALSTLQPKIISLNPYTKEETREIMRDHVRHAFQPNVLPENLLDKVAKVTSEFGDIRLGFSILLSAGYSAERAGRTEITDEDIKSATKSEETTEILRTIGEMRKRLEKRRKTGREMSP